MSMAEDRLGKLGLSLVRRKKPPASSCLIKIKGDLLFVGGVTSNHNGKEDLSFGRVGIEISREQGCEAARLAGKRLLDAICDGAGGMDYVDFIISVNILINCATEYIYLNAVADGVSDILTQVLGNRGVHTRTVLGVCSLEGNSPVVCDALVKLRR